MTKGRTCGEIHGTKCHIHPSHLCNIVLEHGVEDTADAVSRAREVIGEMDHDWTHKPDAEFHSCKLCSIERKNGFPTGYLNNRDRRRYWVKKDKRERKRGEKMARERGHKLPGSHPMRGDLSITPTKVEPKKPKKTTKKKSSPKRSTSQSQRKSPKKRKKK